MKSLGKVFAAAAFLIITNVFALGQNDSSKTVTALTSGTNNFVAASVERVSATSVKIVFDLSIANSEFSGPLSFSAQSGVSIPVDGGMILKMLDHVEALKLLEPEDLIHYGLIPEFVGRLPVVGTLTELDEDALVTILTQPKNALIKQYQRKFEFDNIGLKFTDGAIRAIAHEAHKRKVGARGLMMILEEILLESMYVLPSEKKVKELVITKEMVERKVPVFEVVRSEEAA